MEARRKCLLNNKVFIFICKRLGLKFVCLIFSSQHLLFGPKMWLKLSNSFCEFSRRQTRVIVFCKCQVTKDFWFCKLSICSFQMFSPWFANSFHFQSTRMTRALFSLNYDWQECKIALRFQEGNLLYNEDSLNMGESCWRLLNDQAMQKISTL